MNNELIELYSEMFDTKVEIEKQLSRKEREFDSLSNSLTKIGMTVSIDNISLLSNLSEIQTSMNRVSQEYSKTKKASEAIKRIIMEFQIGLNRDKAIEAYSELKYDLELMEILKPRSLEQDGAKLSLKDKKAN